MLNDFTTDIIHDGDITEVTNIYNSNKEFLHNHLGNSKVSKEFVLNEINSMKKLGFKSISIKDGTGKVIGVCDYKVSDEVYLSLLMINRELKGNGLGKKIYNILERKFRDCNSNSIRIDVVYGYEDNPLEFWLKQGFSIIEDVELEWNGHKSNAYKMKKNIRNNFTIRESKSEENDFVVDELVNYNLSKVPAKQVEHFLWINRVVENDDGQVIAGILSKMYCWNCLYIDALWVDARYRREGIGQKLLLEVEQIAKNKGCYLIHLDTFDFQAKDFYTKNGYEIFGKLEDCPEEHIRYFMKKRL